MITGVWCWNCSADSVLLKTKQKENNKTCPGSAPESRSEAPRVERRPRCAPKRGDKAGAAAGMGRGVLATLSRVRIGAGRGDLPYLPVLVPPCPSPLVSLCLPAHRLPSHHLYAPQPPPWGGGCRPGAACEKRNAVGPGRGGWSQSPPGGGGGRPAAGRWGQEPGDTRRDFVAATPGGHGAERQPRPRHLRAAPGAPRPPGSEGRPRAHRVPRVSGSRGDV